MPKVQQSAGARSGRHRRGRSGHVATALAEINVVPLVDVMLVLLIIFMVAAPMMQQGLNVNLPQARRAAPMEAQVSLYVTVPLTFRQDRMVQLGDARVRADVLAERIRQTMLTRTNKEVFLRGDGGVTLQELIDVMDRLKEGGVEKVGILSQPKPN